MTANSSTVPCAAHFTLQGKGGVGKSLVAAIIAQYFKSIADARTTEAIYRRRPERVDPAR